MAPQLGFYTVNRETVGIPRHSEHNCALHKDDRAWCAGAGEGVINKAREQKRNIQGLD